MQVVPISATPSQTVSVSLGGQACSLKISQKSTGVFMDVYVNEVLIIGGVICENKNRIVHSLYLGFIGDLAFFDTQGTDDPDYTGMGTRWILIYLAPGDIVWPEPSLPPPPFVPLPIPPSPPTGFTVAPAFEKNTLTWDTVVGMTYNLYWATVPGVTTSTGTKISGVASGYVHASLADNTTYYYVLKVNDAYGNSALSSQVSGLTLPAAPAGLSATAGAYNSGTVIIGLTEAPPLQYNFYYSTTPGVTISTGTKVTGFISPYSLLGLNPNTPYYFIATAVNATGEGPSCLEITGGVAGDVVSYTTLNAVTNAHISIGPGGLTAVSDSSGTAGTALSNDYLSAATMQCEFICTGYGTQNSVGLVNSLSTAQPGIAGSKSYGYQLSGGGVTYDGTGVGAPDATIGDVIGFVFDPSLGEISAYLNGNLIHTFTGVTGSWAPAIGGAFNTATTIKGPASAILNSGPNFYFPVVGAVAFGSVIAAPTPSAPTAPTSGTAIGGPGCLVLGWNPVASAASYNVYWSITPGVTPATGIKISAPINAAYLHAGLAHGVPYYYVVTAVNAIGESGPSAQFSGTTLTYKSAGFSNFTTHTVVGDVNIFQTDTSGTSATAWSEGYCEGPPTTIIWSYAVMNLGLGGYVGIGKIVAPGVNGDVNSYGFHLPAYAATPGLGYVVFNNNGGYGSAVNVSNGDVILFTLDTVTGDLTVSHNGTALYTFAGIPVNSTGFPPGWAAVANGTGNTTGTPPYGAFEIDMHTNAGYY